MKSVLISIKPKYCELIVNKKKTIEVRKSRPKIDTPFKCYIYMSQGDFKDLGSYSEWIYKNRMKVIGEFICDKVFLLHPYSYDGGNADLGHHKFIQTFEGPSNVIKILSGTCLSQDEMFDYIGVGNYGYAWHISDIKIYDKPKDFREFRNCLYQKKCCVGEKCEYWGYSGCESFITRPPNSWFYVEEI